MMIDFANTPGDLWTWTTNVSDGKSVDASDRSSATAFWNDQVNAWNQWNQNHPSNPVSAESNTAEGPCVFTMTGGTGGNIHPYSDALAIKAYNSGSPYHGSPYIQFSNGAWSINNTNIYAFDYVYRVCATSP